MKALKIEQSSIPFIPSQVVISKNEGHFNILHSWFTIKWNNISINDFWRITNKEWLLLFTHKTIQILIAWVFTHAMPVQMSLKKFILNYLDTHILYNEQWQQYQVNINPKSRFWIVNQIQYSPEELAKTTKQLQIKRIINPFKYQQIIATRMEYNNPQQITEE